MKSLAKNTIFNVIYNVCSLLFPLVTSMYISRILLEDGVGSISYARNIASYFETFAAFGLPVYGLREIAKVQNNQLNTNKTFTELFSINFITTLVASLLYCILIPLSLHNSLDTRLTIFFGFSVLFNFINVDWFYQGKEEYVYISCRSIFIKAVSLICTLLLIKTKDDYIKYALILVFANGGNYIFNIIHIRKLVKFDFKGIDIKRHISPLTVLAASIFLSTLYSKLDITMLGSISTKTATGLYSNAHRTIDMLVVASASVSAVFLPRLSYFYENSKSEFTRLIEFGIRTLSFTTMPIAAGLFIISSPLIELLYGADFLPAAITVKIFSVLILVRAFGDLLCYQLVICTGNEKKRLQAYAMAAGVNIVLNALLIPHLAENGAAIASVISELTVNLYQFIKIKKLVTIPFPKKAAFQGVFATLIMSASIIPIVCIENIPSIIQCISALAVGAVVYIIANLIMKNIFLIDCITKIKGKLIKK